MKKHILYKIRVQGIRLFFLKMLKHLFNGKIKNRLHVLELCLIKHKIKSNNYNITPSIVTNELCDYIWVCWLQGKSKMPEIVQLCYDSILKHSGHHSVILLTLDNYKNYCNLPPKYETMLQQGYLMPALFADMLRINLLAQHGGLWLDATIYVKEDIPDEFFTYPFFSMHFHPDTDEISSRRWTSYCLGRGTEKDPVFCKMAAFFDDYTSRNREFIDYFLFDFALDYIYDNDIEARQAIDAVPMNNTQTASLYGFVCSPFSQELFDELTKDTILFKLRYRANEETIYDLIDNGSTIFAHMCRTVYNGSIPFVKTESAQ